MTDLTHGSLSMQNLEPNNKNDGENTGCLSVCQNCYSILTDTGTLFNNIFKFSYTNWYYLLWHGIFHFLRLSSGFLLSTAKTKIVSLASACKCTNSLNFKSKRNEMQRERKWLMPPATRHPIQANTCCCVSRSAVSPGLYNSWDHLLFDQIIFVFTPLFISF